MTRTWGADPRFPPTSGWNGLSAEDARFLIRAVQLGRGGWGRVQPNPMVGCVIVRDGQVVAEGFHESFGGPHAEAEALRKSGGGARKATAYVSLEPCRHVGKTPPCAPALLAAGVERVVYWAMDPGEVEGGGGAWLRGQGVRVDGPFGTESEWRAENPIFFHTKRSSGPYVALKLAISSDGGLAPPGGRRHWLTGPEARQEVHRLRAGFDAILVGANTWRADDPRLTVRGELRPARPPLRIFLDSRGEMSREAAAFSEEGEVLLAVADGAAEACAGRLGDRADVLALPAGQGGLDLRSLVQHLDGRGVRSVLCEGGGRLASSLVSSDLVHRLYMFRAPTQLGSGRVPAFPGLESQERLHGDPLLSEEYEFDSGRWRRILPPQTFGRDVLITLDRSE